MNGFFKIILISELILLIKKKNIYLTSVLQYHNIMIIPMFYHT